jgi:acetate kinase
MKILVLNTGSSTVKFSLIESDDEQPLLEGLLDWASPPARLRVGRPGEKPEESVRPAADPASAVTDLLGELERRLGGRSAVGAVGHRVVHGGAAHTRSERVTEALKESLAGLAELAPLHNPINLEGIRAAEKAWPAVPHVAVFDTAFHATMSDAARTYAVPHSWTEDWGLRRFGFHGLSVAYCADRAARMLGRPAQGLRLVVCHLGNGGSVTAVADGRGVDTTMGFTPLEGIVMGTRSGSVDPGLLLFLLHRKGLSADDLDRALNREAGLLGLSGVSGDLRQVQLAARAGQPRARLAMEVYAHRLRQAIGAMAATLGGVEALVFTAGIGEHSAEVRAQACRGLECLGLELDPAANLERRPDADVAAASSKGRILVIATREDLTIVRETVRVLRG